MNSCFSMSHSIRNGIFKLWSVAQAKGVTLDKIVKDCFLWTKWFIEQVIHKLIDNENKLQL